MPPSSDGTRTVACSLEKLVPDTHIVSDIRLVVARAHEATTQATTLLNLHIRRCVADGMPVSADLFNHNFLLKAFYEVTECRSVTRASARDRPLAATAERFMSDIRKVPRDGLVQVLHFNAEGIAATARTNVWKHFGTRVHSYVKAHLKLPKEEYDALTKEQRAERALRMFRIATDIRKPPDVEMTSAAEDHAFVELHRTHLHIDDAIGDWDGKPLLYHLKAAPHRFVLPMALMSKFMEQSGGKAFALYPLRRSLVPRFVRFDAFGFQKAMQAMKNEREGRRVRKKNSDDITFANSLNYRAAGVAQRWRLEDGFCTDGVSARLQQLQGPKSSLLRQRVEKADTQRRKQEGRKRKREEEKASGAERKAKKPTKKPAKKAPTKPKDVPLPLAHLPTRGMWAIDEIKHLTRAEDTDDQRRNIHVVGIDPGKRELIVATDSDDPRSHPVRYTLRQRQKDMRLRQYADESRRSVPLGVHRSLQALSHFNSRSSSLRSFHKYAKARQQCISECLEAFSDLSHRRRRWKTYIKGQASEESVYAKLRAMRTDDRPLVLAYGSWGLVAGRTGACNKGNPPCIGVGLMRKIARRFLVVPTPEQYTSKTCHRCFGECGPHPTMRTSKNKEIRGLRVCQDESCRSHLNRDTNASRNIGLQLKRLLQDQGPIRQLSDRDLEFNRHQLCLGCEE